MKRREFPAALRRRAGRELLARAARAAAPGAQNAGAEPKKAPHAAGQPQERAMARLVDPHRRQRRDHRLHRQGRARAGHQDRAHPGRGRRARVDRARSRSSPPTPRARRTRATRPAASRCRTAGRRSCTPPRRCARSWSRSPRSGWTRRSRDYGASRRPCRAKDGRSITYGQLVTGETLHVEAAPESPLRDPKTRGVMGKSMQRVDIPAKVTGGAIYVQDLRLPGMVHARVVRPPSYGARLESVDSAPR